MPISPVCAVIQVIIHPHRAVSTEAFAPPRAHKISHDEGLGLMDLGGFLSLFQIEQIIQDLLAEQHFAIMSWQPYIDDHLLAELPHGGEPPCRLCPRPARGKMWPAAIRCEELKL